MRGCTVNGPNLAAKALEMKALKSKVRKWEIEIFWCYKAKCPFTKFSV